jgi:UDP-3-O-[3-hydroxymyristoyl] glucosamine N-acyltransferase
MMMLLSELRKTIPPSVDLEIFRDGEFENLGYVSHPINTQLLLVFIASERYVSLCLKNPLVSSVITDRSLAQRFPERIGVAVSASPMLSFYALHRILFQAGFYWRDFDTFIDPTATVSSTAWIASQNVKIGPRSVIEPGVHIKERSLIGADCSIRTGTIISSEGFEYKDFGNGMELIPHAGGVKIEEHVNIHANCVIDRGVFGENTVVGSRSCLDNFVHLAHGVKIGRNCLITAGVTFAAAVVVGDNSRIDPNATLAHELVLGARSYVTLGSVVVKNVSANERVTGNFAIDHRQFLRKWYKAARR